MEAQRRTSTRIPLSDRTNTLVNQNRKAPSKSLNSNNSSDASSFPSNPLSYSGGREHKKSGNLVVQRQTQAKYTTKDKGKMVAEDPVVKVSDPSTSSTRQLRPTATAGGRERKKSGNLVVQTQTQAKHSTKDKEKVVAEDPLVKVSDQSTSSTRQLQPTAAAGRSNGGRTDFLTVYSWRKTAQRRNSVTAKIAMPLSHPPGKRTKKMSDKLGVGRSGSSSGSHTDPIPAHRKKRARVSVKSSNADTVVHAMPEEEVKKLRAYYADIDAFELPEEEVSGSELE